jgi:sarcosine oxidase gamma subunit
MNFPQFPSVRRYTPFIAAALSGAILTVATGALVLSTITPPAPQAAAVEQRISVQRSGPDPWFQSTTSSILTADPLTTIDAGVGESVLPQPDGVTITVRIEERTENGEWKEKTSALRFGHNTE